MQFKVKTKKLTKSLRSGLTFPVGRVHRYMKKLNKKMRISAMATIYQTAVMEYLTTEVLEIAGNVTKNLKKKRLEARHIFLAVALDSELKEFLRNVTIISSGVVGENNNDISIKVNPNNSSYKKSASNLMKKKFIPKISAKKSNKINKVIPAASSITILSEKVLRNGQKLTIMKGNIALLDCQAIVNPTGSTIAFSGQVGRAISKAGTGQLLADCLSQSHDNIPACHVIMTNTNGHLKSKNILHVNSPQWDPNDGILNLQSAVKKIFDLVDEHKLTNIALPSIGSGGCNYPKQIAAETILNSISTYFVKNPKSNIKQVYFVLFDTESVNVYTTELAKIELE